jgi:CTP:molybdopterin cytidylyltransferase MocA
MQVTGLEVRLREGRERAEVKRVAWAMNEVVRSLQEIDHVYLLRGTRAAWVMADMMRDDQDLVLRLEPRRVPSSRSTDDILVPANALVAGVNVLTADAVVPAYFAAKTVTRMETLASPKEGIQSVSLAVYNGKPGEPVVLSDSLRENAAAAVSPYEFAYGSVTGNLSGIKEVRGGNLKVTVRDEMGRQAVDGVAPAAMSESLRSAWRHRVSLIGMVRRNAHGQAIRIEAEDLSLLPEDDSGRPLTADLLGVAEGWLGEVTVDDFIRQMRDG